jgi:hypothetical protein
MRKDMDKLLVTTPRVGSSWKNKEVKQSRRQAREGDYTNLPSYSSMKPKTGGWDDRKSFNEYLNPLVRFLKKNCNRPWDKVYSEICKNMDKRGTVKAHIFQHLFDYVERRPIIKNGKPYQTGWGGLQRLYKTGWTFYVDKNGTLREPKGRRPAWRTNEDEPNLIKTSDPSVFIIMRKKDKTWFRAILSEWPHDALHSNNSYIDLACHDNPEWIVKILGRHNTSNKKITLKTLSKKEKKLLKL